MSELRRLRIDAGLTVEQLASKAKVSPTQIRNFESGRVRSPRMTTLNALARALKAKPSDIDPMLNEKAAA